MESIEFENIINKKDIERGRMILLSSRPGVGKTKTCIQLLKKFKNYESLYFDLSGNLENDFQSDINIVRVFKSSLEIISMIENFVQKKNAKFVFIDSWQCVEDKNDWFLFKLLTFCIENKLVIVVTSNLGRIVEKRRRHIPKFKDLKDIGNLCKFASKIIYIYIADLYNKKLSNDVVFFEY